MTDWVEVAPGRFKRKKDLEARARGHVSANIIPDIQPFVSPVDGTVVGSRSARRAHNARNEVEDVGNDPAFKHPQNKGSGPMPDPSDEIRAMLA